MQPASHCRNLRASRKIDNHISLIHSAAAENHDSHSVYDDWPSLRLLIGDIHVAMNTGGWSYEIVIVDDGSPNEMPFGSEIKSKSERCLGITYIDVLEHIQDDSEELRRSASLLREGGAVIVLAPAYAWLVSPFDKAVGHFRRYVAATPANLRPARVFYLDSIGLLLSLANRLFLRQSIPSRWQILFWDRILIPLSRVMDRVIRFRAGRSIVAIWRKPRMENPANTPPAIGV